MTVPALSPAGKVALVTGGSRGIGKSLALAYAEAALFLASDVSKYVTGQTIVMESGGLAQGRNR